MKRLPETTFTVLGCGTSGGVPFIHCRCTVCRSRDPRDKRLRCSLWVQRPARGSRPAASIVIDTGPDFRQQAIRAGLRRVDAVLYTHPHADHTHGIDELRSYNFVQKRSIPVYGNAWSCRELRKRFEYVFKPYDYHREGGGSPILELRQFNPRAETLDVAGIKVVPIGHSHGSHQGVGYRFESVAYLTDTSYIPASSLNRLKDLDVLFLDCLRLAPHDTHLNLGRALEVVSELRPKKTFLTHLGHDFGYAKWMKKLPKGVSLAYDGLKIKTSE